MTKNKRPVLQMLEQLEQRYYLIVPELRAPDGRRVLQVHCRHCNLILRFDDNDHEQAQQASEVYRQHLKTQHADLLKQEHDVSIQKL